VAGTQLIGPMLNWAGLINIKLAGSGLIRLDLGWNAARI
jgi:hypothetical protein